MSGSDQVKLPMASSLQQIVGALLFGSNRPLTVEDIRTCLKSVADADGEECETVKLFAEASPREVKDAIECIGKELSRIGLGVEITEVNSGYRFQTQACCGRWLRNLLKLDRPNRLSRPALETLAIVAYRQPISKSEIEAIRGVMADHIIKALMELHLVRIVGRSDLPGRPFLYGTTATFLDHFGLKSLNELNALDPTLQRSKPSERKAIHRREKSGEKQEPKAGDLSARGAADAAEAVGNAHPAEVDADAVAEILGGDESGADAEPLYETGEAGGKV